MRKTEIYSSFSAHFSYRYEQYAKKNANFGDIAQIVTDEAETWHTLRFEHAEPENIN